MTSLYTAANWAAPLPEPANDGLKRHYDRTGLLVEWCSSASRPKTARPSRPGDGWATVVVGLGYLAIVKVSR